MNPGAERRKTIIIYASTAFLIVFLIAYFVINNASWIVKTEGLRDAISKDIPDRVLEDIDAKITMQLKDDYGEKEGTNKKVKVRSGSERAFPVSGEGAKSGELIVDIEALKQSYLVYYKYDNKAGGDNISDGSATTLFCLSDEEKIIYPESACKEDTEIDDEKNLYLILPAHETTLDDGKKVEFRFSYGNEVIATVNACKSAVNEDDIIKKAKEWVGEYGLDEEEFKYSVPLSYDNCLMKVGE